MYPGSLENKEWSLIEAFFNRKDPRGAKEKHSKRSIVNAIFYVVKTGVQWRLLPNDMPPWSTVYSHYRKWNLSGVWEKLLEFLNRKAREKKGKKAEPTFAIIDSQSVKTQYASEERGIDGGKKVKGRKRHICVDTLGNLLCVMVHAANIHDTKGAPNLFQRTYEKYPTIQAFCGDAGYCGTSVNFVKDILGLRLDISKKIKDQFVILPKRWIVERTLSWLGASRRLSKDFEILTGTAENVIRIAMIKITLAKCG